MQWKPNRSKPLIAGIPLKRPSQEQVNKAYMLFYSMIGGFASVVQTQITEKTVPHGGKKAAYGGETMF